MLPDSIFDKLDDFAIFGGISPDTLGKVAHLFEQGSYPAGARIIEQGDTGNRLYVIASGRVQVSVHCAPPNRSAAETILASYGRGASFGEMELLDTQNRSATVTALEPTETAELTGMQLYRVFLQDAEVFRLIIMNLARDLSRRLRIADQQLALVQIEEDPTRESLPHE